MSSDLILHHYEFSNFSEKVRLVFGLKDLAWSSVEIPAFEPKPDYTPLTCGYRRTPALQIGADIYCDTALILEVLEALRPVPSLYPGPNPDRTRALSLGLTAWAETQLIRAVALHITGLHARTFPMEFHSDRARLHGKPAPDIFRVEASAHTYLPQVWPQMARIEDMLSVGSDYILGQELSLADLSVYEAPWFIETIGGRCDRLDGFPLTRAWMQRVADLGHGRKSDLSANDALDRASGSEPVMIEASGYEAPEGVAIGDEVVVSPMAERSPASGTLLHVDAERVSLRTNDGGLGEVHVHFPRLGYRLSRDSR